jgi:hypothetical protein
MATTKSVCLICSRATADKYCEYHRKSFDKLISNYASWKRALGDISWVDYLTKLLDLQETGSSIKDIIEKELNIR